MTAMVGVVSRLLAGLLRVLQLVTGFVMSMVYRSPGKTLPTLTSSVLSESATSLASRIRAGKVTSVEVVKTFISRIEQINPALNCVVDDRFAEALDDAAKADELVTSGRKTKEELEAEMPLLGVPFTTKDCMAVKGMLQTGGLYARRDRRAEQDSEVVRRLRRAGAIPLALTNVPELCMWWESSNHVHGTTCNPYDTNRIPGGSSGGEGSVLSASGSPLGIGSDIGGSIRIPSFFNGIFGHKASSGAVPLEGHFPEAADIQKPYQSIGPMSRYSADLRTTLKIIAKTDLRLDEKVDVSKLKLYYMDDDGGSPFMSPVDPEIKKAIKKAVDHFRKAHGVTAQRVNLTKLRNAVPMFLAKFATKEGPGMAVEMADRQGKVNLWTELVRVALRVSKHTLPAVLFAIIETITPQYGSPLHAKFVDLCEQLKGDFKELLGEDGVFLYPTHPTPALYHNESIVKPFNFNYTAIFNVSELPATHVPMGLNSQGLPIGFQVVAGRNNDRLTLAVAGELEKAFGGWVPPPTHGTAILRNAVLHGQ